MTPSEFVLHHRTVWVLVLACAVALPSRAADDVIWIEGEAATSSTMRRHSWYDSVTKDALSGGDWLSHFGGGEAPLASFQVEMPRAGEYELWVRCNPVASPKLSVRLEGREWKKIDTSGAIESTNIAADGKPDMRFIAWVNAGRHRLSGGSVRIEFRFHSENQNHGAIDCFVLAPAGFRPRGKLRPGVRSGLADEGFFAWEPDVDSFDDSALVDLRDLNEALAGERGRVRARGNDFVLGSGEPVRFWAANAGPALWDLDADSQRYLARRLAKLGVNMVRLHGPIHEARSPEVRQDRLDGLQRLVATLAREGIYSSLSFYFPLWFELDPGKKPFMLLFFDEELQGHYLSWARALLTRPSAHAGQPLGRDPAVAIVELVNEDSHLFWTFGRKSTTEERWRVLQGLFARWLIARHGSLDACYKAWGGVREPGDAPAEMRVDLYDAWAMTRDGLRSAPRRRARVSDQVRFLTENMRSFYSSTIRFLKRECGYDGLVSCGNWHTSDASTLDALERYAYTAGDVIDHHGYFDHGHRGDASSWSVRPGQEFESVSALDLERGNPLPYVETDGHPHIVSEIGWPAPNVYRAEFTFLAACYGSLWGLDGVYAFALGGASWDPQIQKFGLSTPMGIGSFPAAALVYRHGLVKESDPVVFERLDLERLYALEGTRAHVRPALDQLRADAIPDGETREGRIRDDIDPLAFYAGRVVRSFDGPQERSTRKSLEALIDRDAKRVRSSTGELEWDYGRRTATVDTPAAKGAVGFLGARGRIDLGEISIEMENEYGSVLVVSRDGRDLNDSRRILVQCLTTERFHGFRSTAPDNRSGRIESVGTSPIGVERIDARVSFRVDRPERYRVIACDEHGYPRELEVECTRSKRGLEIKLEPTSIYHVLELIESSP